MDKNQELYHEEQIENLKQINKQLSGAAIIPIPQMPDTMKAEVTNKVVAEIVNKITLDEKPFNELSDEIQKTLELATEKIVKAVIESVKEPVNEITVKNIEDAQSKTVKITNFDELQKSITDLSRIIIDNQPIINVEKQNVVFPRLPKDAIPVRLSDGKSFYNAIASAVSSSVPSFVDKNNKAVPVVLNSDGSIPVNVPSLIEGFFQTDVFDSGIIGSRYNQFEVDYSTAAPASITTITVTTANGGTTSQSNGQAVFSTSTNTNGQSSAVTNTSITYRPHAEVYAAFSAIFTTGIASSYQRIGIYNATNGVIVGYEGTEFGVTKRVNSVDTTIAQASFNIDTLSGQTGSKFTRNGVPEALDPTKDNLYRVRYGWLGASNIFCEVLSPDQKWVVYHIFYQANLNTVPSFTSPNLPITVDVKKTTAGATNLSISTACWAAGTTSNLAKVTDTITDNSLAALNRSVITGVTTGGGGAYVNVKVNPSGALATAATIADGDDIVSGNTADAANTTGTTGTISGKLRGVVQNQTNGTQRTKITDGTNNAGIIDPATIGTNANTATSEQDGVIVGPTTKTVTYSLSAAGNSAYYDVANYASVKVQITSQYTISGGSSTITFQISNDATNWYSQSLVSAAGSQSSGTSSTSSSGVIYVGSLGGRYFRVNLSGTYVSGTAAGVITFSTATYAPHSVGVSVGFNSGANTGSITSATSTLTSATITGYTWALLRVSGTYSGVTFSIQQSDDSQTTFLATPVYDIGNAKWLQLTNATTSPSISPADNSTRLFAIPLYASGTVVRIVASAWTSGTANLRVTYTAVAPFHFSTAPAQGNTGSSTPAAADYIGGIATTALPTAATAGNLTGAMVDKFGRQVVLNNSIRDLLGSQTTTISASTTETTIVTAAASVFNDLSAIWFNNTSATAVRVDVRDTTAGSVIWQVYVPAGDMRGISFNTPYPQTSANTNWTATCSASITDLRVTALFVKNR